jgi:hypothetical protein
MTEIYPGALIMYVYDAMAQMPFVDINTQIFGPIMQ